ncbi:MAG: diguanylate cyclase [Gammaproteobacteria bacterium]|nr:MAG: diguanylate cyclase [Gammaproteobacteria bacterium]RLA60159.1 MAG: diguanylate cyclase [Gammaproteobacteria bacterium]
MLNAQAPSSALQATLKLEGPVHLTGELSALLDGRLQLGATQLLEGPPDGGKVSLKCGSVAMLSVTSTGALDGSLHDAQVSIAGISGDCITLEFADPAGACALSYRNAIAGGFSNSSSPALTAATAQYTELLGILQQQSLSQLEQLLLPFFDDLTGYLVDLSSRIKQPKSGENLHYNASIIMRRMGQKIIRDMVQQTQDYYQDLTPAQTDDQLWQHNIEDANELDLIDIQDFEDFLAIDRMITLGVDLHQVLLEALVIRLATLIDTDPNKIRLPMHVRQLCGVFQRALTAQKIPKEVLPHIFDYFARYFIRQLDDYFIALNAILAERGVRPDVEQEIRSHGSLLGDQKHAQKPRRKTPTAKPEAAAHDPSLHETVPVESGKTNLDQVHRQLGEQLTGAIGHFSPASLYRSVIDALNFKREAEGLADGETLASGTALSGTWDGATVASTEVDQDSLADAHTIAQALGTLQRDSQVRADVQQSDSLREYLASNKDQIGSLRNTSGLTADSLNQLDMVDNLFGTIKSQLDVTSELKPALGNLQIPLAKLALLEPRFFVDRSHVARTVVDKLSQLATSANFPNKALEGRINNIVDEITLDYESDSSVFDVALEKIDKLVAQQERALSRNIERVVRTQEGQERLQKARQAVAKVISARIKPPAAPRVLMDLVESGWRDLLVLTHVKEGPDSYAWTEHIKTLDLLCLWLNEQQQGDIDEDLVVQRGLEAEPLIDLIGQQIANALPTNISHEIVLLELRDILAGNRDVVCAEVSAELADVQPEPAEVRAKIEDLPRLRRWVNRVEQLQKDSWLAYRDKDGQKRRMQLAWISEARDRYIFVNERGQKIADLSAIKLARQLSRGVQPPAPADKLSVVDQSMYHTLEHVQKTLSFARNHDSLTKLINRETFLDQMSRALRHTQLKQSQHAVLYLNIDQFSLVNDVYDRVNGDQVLLEFAKLLAQMHGKKSSSARIDADEFALLLLDRPMELALQVAEKIRRDIEASSVDIDGESVTFTVSIGVAPILEHSPGVEDVLDAARTAMHHAKEDGRNRVVAYEEEQARASTYKQDKVRTRQDLEKALATERFVLRAQPIVQTTVDGTGSSTLHFELLLGLLNKDGTLASPVEFIESAERYGFMSLVDRWVVREAFNWISQLMDAQKVVPNLAINLSGSSVTDDSFMDYLLEQISEFGVGTSRLCFEITETGTISNLVKAADFVRAFRNIGCKFSIDDFGTGLASHNYLRELPVDYVKIDGSFVTGIHKNRSDYAMARSINDLAHFLGQETIAESVENDEIIVKLEEIGVDYLQGWGIGKPKLLAEVSDHLSSIEK